MEAPPAIPENVMGSLTVYKGDDSVSRRHRLNPAEIEAFPFNPSMGFGVLRAIILRNLQQTLDPQHQATLATTLKIRVKPSTVAPQNRFIVLTDENFEQVINRVYSQARVR